MCRPNTLCLVAAAVRGGAVVSVKRPVAAPGRYGILGHPTDLAGHVAALSDARHMNPQALADWLAQWTP